MANSITASNSSAPFNGYLLTDATYVVTASIASGVGGVSTGFNLKNVTPFPSINDTTLYVACTATTGPSSSYITLQGSPDNSTWTNLSYFANPVLTVSGSATSANLTLQPGTPQYVRVSSSVQAGSAATATVTMALLF